MIDELIQLANVVGRSVNHQLIFGNRQGVATSPIAAILVRGVSSSRRDLNVYRTRTLEDPFAPEERKNRTYHSAPETLRSAGALDGIHGYVYKHSAPPEPEQRHKLKLEL